MNRVAFNYIVYTLQIHDCLTELRRLLSVCAGNGQVDEWIAQTQALDKRLETMHFQLAVVGEFKRGKTSFINALLRREILPADVVPATATVNRITYGDTPSSTIEWNDGTPDTKIGIDELSAYITKITDSAAATASRVRQAVVRYPCRFCENNVDLIDTPGMNDDEDMNGVTIAQLSDIDLAVVLLDPNFPVSETEAAFIAKLVESEQVCGIVFVVSKMDTVYDDDARERLMELIRRRLYNGVRAALLAAHEEGGEVMNKFERLFAEIILFPVSSRQALHAYEMGDRAELEASGFARLNEELLPLIMRAQHSASVLTPLRTAAHICRDYEALLRADLARAEDWERLCALRRRFAETAYNQGEDPVVISSDASKIWARHSRDAQAAREKNVRQVSSELAQAVRDRPETAGRVAFLKEYFPQLVRRLAEEEDGALSWAAGDCMAYCGQIAGRLEALLEPYPDLLGEMSGDLRRLDDDSPLTEEPTEPNAFYWESSPLPPDSVAQEDVPQWVENVVRVSFDDYCQRRLARVSERIRKALAARERRITALVQKFFRLTGQKQPEPLLADDGARERLCGELRQLRARCEEAGAAYLREAEFFNP